MFESVSPPDLAARLRRCAIAPTLAMLSAAAYLTFIPFFGRAARTLFDVVDFALVAGMVIGLGSLAYVAWLGRRELDARALASAAIALLASLGSAFLFLSMG